VVLDFYGTFNIGHHTCIIDDLAVIPGGAVPVTYTPERTHVQARQAVEERQLRVKMGLFNIF